MNFGPSPPLWPLAGSASRQTPDSIWTRRLLTSKPTDRRQFNLEPWSSRFSKSVARSPLCWLLTRSSWPHALANSRSGPQNSPRALLDSRQHSKGSLLTSLGPKLTVARPARTRELATAGSLDGAGGHAQLATGLGRRDRLSALSGGRTNKPASAKNNAKETTNRRWSKDNTRNKLTPLNI